MRINWRVFRDIEWTADLARVIISIATFLAFSLFLTTFITGFFHDARRQFFPPTDAQAEGRLLKEQVQKTQNQIAAVEASVQRSNEAFNQALAAFTPKTGSMDSGRSIALLRGEVTSLKSEVSAMHASLDALNAALLTTPDKALSIPLLRKDLEDFRVATQHDEDSIRLEMGRAYELNKWLMGFLLAAVLGMIINNLIQSKTSRVQSKVE